MNHKSLFWGIGITVVWFLIIGWFCIQNDIGFTEKSLNSLGDFLAGIFAPVAFFWLVYGYFQNAYSIKLQTDELKEAVKAQTELARMQRKQLLMIQQEKRPFLKLYNSKVNLKSDRFKSIENQLNTADRRELSFILENEGEGTAKFVQIRLNHNFIREHFDQISPKEQKAVKLFLDEQEVNLLYSTNYYLTLTIKFTDVYDNSESAFYDFSIESQNENELILAVLSYQNCENSKVAN